ncbi:MAG: alkaline phosphatase family protein [Proteobacteria bacterium]|nr:alkaline phosphatase family protein [Pseudomonadota bacterium]
MVSLDGARFDYPERTALPGLERIRREGASAGSLRPVTPSSTFPSHVSLATGTYPDRHGIVANRFRDPQRGEFDYSDESDWLRAEPLWIAAERQGLRAAVLFWVGSGSEWRGRAASYRRTPFDPRVSEREKVDQILDWLRLPAQRRPRLVMSWWHGPDRVGHRKGPDSPAVDEQMARQDAELVRLLEGLDALDRWDCTTLIVLGDHGMARVGRSIDLRLELRRQGLRAKVWNSGGTAYVELSERETLSRALESLRALEGVEAYPSAALPERYRLAGTGRTGDLVAFTTPPFRFGRSLGLPPRGAHGYPAEVESMGSIFFALGRGVGAGARLGRVRAIDVAPSVAALLGIEPPLASEGRSLLPELAPRECSPTRCSCPEPAAPRS